MKWLYKLLPSSQFKKDVNLTYNQIDAIVPIDLTTLSLIEPMKKRVLTLRQRNKHLQIQKLQKKMTLVIPYRHREEHLKKFLPYISNYLRNQQIDFEIIVAEQLDSQPFNKAKLMNIAALHARKESEYFVFHDVDLLPENIDYRYCNHTQKLFYEIRNESSDSYKSYKQSVLGGAILIPKDIFFAINGYSNSYWQWGREDDDFFMRHIFKGYIPVYDKNGKFVALEHDSSLLKDNTGNVSKDKQVLKQNKKLFMQNKKLFSNFKRGLYNQQHDGVSTLKNYTIKFTNNDNGVKTIGIYFGENR